jgi:hypothetical protein
MIQNMSDTRILREQQTATLAASDRLKNVAEDGTMAVLAQTTTITAYPTVPGAFYACIPLWVDGLETEGAAANFTPIGLRIVYAFNLGTQIPPVGAKIIAHSCGGRWSFHYNG